MKCLILLLVLFHLTRQSAPCVGGVNVTCNKVCSCFKNEKITCPQDVKLTMTDKPFGVLVKLKCTNSQSDLSVLTGLNLTSPCNGFDSLEVDGCYLSNLSFHNRMAKLGVSGYNLLDITSYRGILQKRNFENLDIVNQLQITKSDLGTLPVDIFERLQNLTYLIMLRCSCNLTNNVFQSTQRISYIRLSLSNKSEVRFEVFNNLTNLVELEVYGTKNTSIFLDSSNQFTAPKLNNLIIRSIRFKILPNSCMSTNSSSKQSLNLPRNEKIKDSNLLKTNPTDRTFLLCYGLFAGLTSLKYVKVVETNLEDVPENMFTRSANILKLNLRNNLIKTFKENTFSDLENLALLDVSHNKISHLPERLFYRTSNLEVLDLSYNLLESIELLLFLHLTQLTVLDMSHNNIRCVSGEQFSQLKKLRDLDMSHNQLMSLAMDPLLSDFDQSVLYNCKQLKYLYLQNNLLAEFYDDWSHQLTDLKVLNLSNNMFTKIWIKDITHVREDVILANNLITDVEFVFTDSEVDKYSERRSHNTDLSNNSLNCCNEGLSRFLTREQPFFNISTKWWHHEKCHKPKEFYGMTLKKLFSQNYDLEKEICSDIPPETEPGFQYECPKGFRCLYRPISRSFVIQCQNLNLRSFPQTLPVAPEANHSELNLYGNKLQEFIMPDDPGYRNVTFLHLANNFLQTLDIRTASHRLKKLDIRNNKLTTLSEETLEVLENALELERLELEGNPWKCDISNERLFKLVNSKQKLIWRKFVCPEENPIEKVEQLLESHRRQIMTSVVSGVVGTLLLTVFILTVLYYRNRQKVHVYCFSSRWKLLRWLVSHPDLHDDDKLYDAFLVFSQEDEMFVVNHLVPYLEETEERKYKLCLHFRDWIPGEQILSQIGRSVRSSRRTIVVLSPNFLRSVWGVAEFRMAHAEALKDGTARVIVVLYEDVSDELVDEELKAYLQTNTYVRWGSAWFWKQLTYALPHPSDRERAALHYFSSTQTCQGNLNNADLFEMRSEIV